jgi:DNA-binding NarL/FixJ family response regulator
MTRRASILIADDHLVVAEALAASLERWFRVCGIVDTLEAIPAALRRHTPAVTLIDLSFGQNSSLRILPKLVKEYPDTAFVVLTAHPEEVLVDTALRAGAKGYVIKRSAPAEVRVAIEEALDGRTYVTPLVKRPPEGSEAIPKHLVQAPEVVQLHERQVRILQLMGRGMTYREVADTLAISTKTIDYHLNILREKLGIAKVTQLVRWAETNLPPDASQTETPMDPEVHLADSEPEDDQRLSQ